MLKPTALLQRGVTLIELLVTIALVAILMRLAIPSFSAWIANNKVRTVADALQNGLRTASSEALRRNRQVTFTLTNQEPSDTSTAAANGRNWAVHRLPALTSENGPVLIKSGSFGSSTSGAAIAGPAAICINSAGRVVANNATGVPNAVCSAAASQNCAAGTSGMASLAACYQVTAPGSDRTLQVTVGFSGQVRMCDPKRSLASSPDGC
jgi:type IV fimbrial biogenesis protein FimT